MTAAPPSTPSPSRAWRSTAPAWSSSSTSSGAAGPDNTDFTNWTEEQQTAFWDAFWKGGEKFAQEIVDYCVANSYAEEGDVAGAAAAWAYPDLAADATAADFFQAIVDNYGYDLSDAGINAETAGSSITDFIYAELGDQGR